jgi:hypothetical protein
MVYSFIGAFQFAPGVLRRAPAWHRFAGKVLIPCGLVVAISGLWMSAFYPITKFDGPAAPSSFDGPSLFVVRLLVGALMVSFLVRGHAAIRARNIPSHRAWMMRGYALGMGAGTQVFTHIPWFLLPSLHGELARTVCMATGWALNLALVEWIIRRK